MSTDRRGNGPGWTRLTPVYAALAVGAFATTTTCTIQHLRHGGSLTGFLTLGFANQVSSFFLFDLLFVAATAMIFMVVDARRTGVRHVWIYIVGSLLIAISVMVPIYLIARERQLREGA
jgi:tetrahydromethanopterin S-methyltransferase subunit D